ncbi:MAG: hypothetical protein ACJ8M1_10760 [Chthoniobacterales bacterium]
MYRRSRLIIVVGWLGLLIGGPLAADNPKQQLNAIVRETQKQGSRAGRITVVWWMPTEFWQAALRANGTVPADKINEAVAALSDVNVFLLVDAKVGALAVVDYAPAAELQKNFSVTDPAGKPVAFIPEARQSMATKNLLAIMKPIMGNMLGEFGKGISFLVFEAKNKDGSRKVDPGKPGILKAKLGEEEFRWRLPLGSLLPDRICPQCSESFPGNYAFCPYDATPLRAPTEK